MRKIILSVAPVAGDSTRVLPEEVAEEALQAAKVGAALVHLHVRDKNGKLSRSLTDFEHTIALISKGSDLIIQGSTGGVSDMTIEERCAPLDCELVEMSSLNAGSVNLGDVVYRNPYPEIKYCTQRCAETGVLPEIEVFEMGMIHNMKLIGEEIDLPKPVLFNMVLGHKGGAPATPKTLALFSQYMPENALWGITHYGRREDFSILTTAVGLGACLVRIGFEDSAYVDATGKARNNAVLVERMARIITDMGLEVATPTEARAILGLKQLS